MVMPPLGDTIRDRSRSLFMNNIKTFLLAAAFVFIPVFITKKIYKKHENGYTAYQDPSDAILEDLRQATIIGRKAADITIHDVQMRLSNEK
jgi:hypothetical protein